MTDDEPARGDESLRRFSETTLSYYGRSAASFWEGTRDHDVSQNIAALLGAIEGTPPFTLLDFGCGPGRDLAQFVALGHIPVGLDGSAEFVDMARAHSGCEVLHQDFLALDLPPAHFSGVFANASLFHVPSAALPRVLRELAAALKPGGVLFVSNPRGQNEEGMNAGRYGVYHEIESWRAFVTGAGLIEIGHYYRPEGLPRDQQPWLATLWHKA